MHDRDSSVRDENPARIVTESGKLREIGQVAPDLTQKYAFGEFQIDAAKQRLLRRGEPVPLRNRPFQVLLYLIKHRGRLVEQSELLTAIWGASDVYHDALRKAVGGIRSALGDDSQQPRFIETYWGKGYRFIGEVIEEGRDTWKASLMGGVAGEALPAPIPIDTASAEGAGTVPPERSRPGIMRIAAGVAAAAVLVGATIAIWNDRLTHRSITTAMPQASSSLTPTPTSESQRADYLEAEYLVSQRSSESIARAIAIFNEITQADPHAGDAYAGLAECYALGYWGFWKIDANLAVRKSAEYAQKAVHADPASGYAHAQLAAALLRQLRIHEAQTEFERALAIRPNDAEVHHAYAIFLDDTRRADSGIQEMKRAIEFQPLSLAYKTDLGMSYFFAKRYADAIAQYKSVLKLDPSYIEAHEYLASMYVFPAQWTQAKTEYAAIDRLRGAGAGDFGQSPLRLITEFKTGEQWRARTGVQAMLASPSIAHSLSLARIYAQLGRSEDALRYLSQVVNSHSPEMFTVPDDPLLSPLHGKPQFEMLASKVSDVFTSPGEDSPVQAAALVIPGTLSR
jgi:DNA-binding winged helix-turn-helix (wHTH) protein/tetratricopeptide (TPR) repeat protein